MEPKSDQDQVKALAVDRGTILAGTEPSPTVLTVSCLCASAGQKLIPRHLAPIYICHCTVCRKTSGLLSASYLPIEPPERLSTRSFDLSPTCKIHFCGVCACQIFRSYGSSDQPPAERLWEVATGALQDGTAGAEKALIDSGIVPDAHVGVAQTIDGGISPWIPRVRNVTIPSRGDVPVTADFPHGANQVSDHWTPLPNPYYPSDCLEGSCLCGHVRFFITRPNVPSASFHAPYPDLLIPYISKHPSLTNPDDVKWWLPGNGKYLAGTCACRSCRLASGFEIQTWTFVPRDNIFFLLGEKGSGYGTGDPPPDIIPLNFDYVHHVGGLQAFESSKDVIREACPRCGATAFWWSKTRPGLIDVSVGLLCAPEGARAENWLEWWKGRVSFSEDAGLGREDLPKSFGESLVAALEDGIRSQFRGEPSQAQ